MGKIIDKVKEKKARFDELASKGQSDIIQDYTTNDPSLKIHCSKCGEHLGFWRMFSQARKVPMGSKYIVRCKHCKYVNETVRGTDENK